jgi:alpha-glucosidase/lysosomal alpha-glucosidase
MMGIEIMGTPILSEGVIRTAYFPETTWFDLITGLEMKGLTDHTIYCSYNDLVPLFIRSGYLVI